MASQAPFEEHRKLLMYVAHKVMRRIHAAGAKTVQFEDVFQELCIAWCIARDKYDQSKGVPFGPYLMRGMSNQINRWVDRELRQHQMAPFDLDAEVEGHHGSDKNVSLHDKVADESRPSAEEALIEKDMADFVLNPLRWRNKLPGLRKREALTPQAAKFVDLIANPPPAVLAIVNGLQARAAYGRDKLNIPSTAAPDRLTAALIFDIMGVDRRERAAIYGQIEVLQKRVSQQ